MPKVRTAALIVSLCLATGGLVRSAAGEEKRVAVDLVPSVASVKPGDSFQIALRFKIKPKWHLYWLNPGDSGLAPAAAWTAPDGVKIAPDLQFPPPRRLAVGSDIESFGYEDELVLLADVTTDSAVAGPIRIDARLNWLVCADTCIPEDAAVSVSVPVGAQTEANSLFAEVVQPVATYNAASPIEATVELNADKSEGRILAYVSKEPIDASKFDLFPPAVEFAVFGKPTVVTTDKGNAIAVPFRVLPGMKEPVVGDAMLVRIDDKGGRRGTLISLRFDFVK